MKRRKMAAPVIITILLVCVLIGYLVGIMLIPFPWSLVGAAVIVALIGVSIFVLRERIQEIRSGEEDDLGKY